MDVPEWVNEVPRDLSQYTCERCWEPAAEAYWSPAVGFGWRRDLRGDSELSGAMFLCQVHYDQAVKAGGPSQDIPEPPEATT